MKKFQDKVIVQTKAGKLRGFALDGIYRFYGVKYATAKRFLPPEPVAPWEGLADATSYGYVAPLMSPNSPAMDLLIPHRFWVENEDCLSLNVWSKDLTGKKPVMVWLHGGGYAAGSSIEMVAYDGANMSEYGDVVTVTINHRLNILGYFDLSSFGPEFANSGNAGQADIVCALEWVRDNIAQFGGDPDNVTIFGQSGGGGKVLSLLQTPAADGLFHKGIMMSGGAGRMRKTERHDREIADMLIEQLGGGGVEKLQTVPFEDLVRAYNAITPKLHELGLAGPMGGWAPVKNDWYVGDPWEVGYTEHAKTVPLMVGSVIAEMGFMGNTPDKDAVPVEQRRAIIAEKFGEEAADQLIAEFKKVYPNKNELVLGAMANRAGLLDFVAKRAADCTAPTYCYLFTYDFPYNGGMPAWHCSDIPFAFHNAELVAICNGEGCDELEKAYFGAYMAFAHTGSPNGAGLAEWPAFTTEGRSTMYFDAVSEAKADADTKLQEIHEKVAPDPFAAMRKRAVKVTF